MLKKKVEVHSLEMLVLLLLEIGRKEIATELKRVLTAVTTL